MAVFSVNLNCDFMMIFGQNMFDFTTQAQNVNLQKELKNCKKILSIMIFLKVNTPFGQPVFHQNNEHYST